MMVYYVDRSEIREDPEERLSEVAWFGRITCTRGRVCS
jgi:hypothetical protein